MQHIITTGNYDFYWSEDTGEIIQEDDGWFDIIGYAETENEARNIVDNWI